MALGTLIARHEESIVHGGKTAPRGLYGRLRAFWKHEFGKDKKMRQSIKRFKLKEGRPTKEDLDRYGFRDGGSWIIKGAKLFCSKTIRKEDKNYHQDYEISFNIAFGEDLNTFNDFDNVLVLDEEFGQPYTPFYGYLNGEIEEFPFLSWVVSEYNEWMSSFDFLEREHE